MSNFKIVISILVIISFLFPTPVVGKIIPKEIKKDEEVEVITIKKGDTLWDLAKIYYNNPLMWRKFEEFNIFTDPNLIFPGEKLVISKKDAKRIKGILEERIVEVRKEIKEAEMKKEEPEPKKEVIEVIKKVPVQDEELLKKIAKLEQEIELLKAREKAYREEIEKRESEQMIKQLDYLKKEEEVLRTSIAELERKLDEKEKERQKKENVIHFLAIGIMCGLILLNAF